jgi:hypothetical protein
MLVVALSVVGCDQTWNSPFRVLTLLDQRHQPCRSRLNASEFVDDEGVRRLVGDGDMELEPAGLQLPEGGLDDRLEARAARSEGEADGRDGNGDNHRQHDAELQSENPVIHGCVIESGISASSYRDSLQPEQRVFKLSVNQMECRA